MDYDSILLHFLEILYEIKLTLLKDFIKDVLAGWRSSQSTTVELPHLLLTGRQSPDLIVALLLDDFFLEELVENRSNVAYPLDQMNFMSIHKVLS